jgi:hypothetical protein
MKTQSMNNLSGRWRRGALALALCSALAACGGAEVLAIPLFTFGFSGTTQATTGTKKIDLFLNPPDGPATATGTFASANMQIADTPSGDNAFTVSYTGSWSGCTFALVVAQGSSAALPAAAGYDGRFSGIDTIVLTPNTGGGAPVLTLQRAGRLDSSFDC